MSAPPPAAAQAAYGPARIYLDFDGVTLEDVQRTTRVLQNLVAPGTGEAQSPFFGRLRTLLELDDGGYRVGSRFGFLDVDGDGYLTRFDDALIQRRIVEGVREDLAPFRAMVIVDGNTSRVLRQMDPDDGRGDVLQWISGRDDAGGFAGGRLGDDPGNVRDDLVNSGGSVGWAKIAAGTPGSDAAKRARFVNMVANTLSHEVGHAIGLCHPTFPGGRVTDLMTWDVAAYGRNLGLTSDPLRCTGSTQLQNSFRTAYRALGGMPTRPWVSVRLRGRLTVGFTGPGQRAILFDLGQGLWYVRLDDDGRPVSGSYVDTDPTRSRTGRDVQELKSINPYLDPVRTIEVYKGSRRSTVPISSVRRGGLVLRSW